MQPPALREGSGPLRTPLQENGSSLDVLRHKLLRCTLTVSSALNGFSEGSIVARRDPDKHPQRRLCNEGYVLRVCDFSDCAIARGGNVGHSWHTRGLMTKPQEYQEQRIIRCETHYQVQEGFSKGPQAGSGVLTTGRVVWVRRNPVGATDSTTAFAEGIGVIAVDPHSL